MLSDTPEELVLSNVSYEDEGWYTCIAANSLGVSYASAYLHVVDSKLSHFLIFQCKGKGTVVLFLVLALKLFQFSSLISRHAHLG
jgi:hypothetical protein